MSDSNAEELYRLGSGLFAAKYPILTLWQTLAEELYQARANFTQELLDSDEIMRQQFTSIPSQNRRDLASAMGALSRPKSQMWFSAKSRDENRNTERAKAWCGKMRDKQATLLYTERANFQRSMQAGDDDFVTFGNAVHSIVEDEERGRIPVYDTHHLRDCAWFENRSRRVVGMYRKWKLALSDWQKTFKTEVPACYKARYDKNPHEKIELWHVSIPIDVYGFYGKKKRNPQHQYASIYMDPAQRTILKEASTAEFPYIVRRWRLMDDSVYAHSPAAMYGLIDARLLQAQSRVVLEAGERVIDPPMIARQEGVVGKVNNYPGAVTYVDPAYDERMGEALRAIRTEANIPLGLDMIQDTRQVLMAANYLNKLNLPSDKDMTAFEVSERISEYIRSVGPVIEPFQDDNSRMLDSSFTMNLRLENFGPAESIPPELRGTDIVWEFDGPLQMAYKRQKLGRAKEVKQWWTELVATNPQNPPPASKNINMDKITRDAVEFIGKEDGWLVEMDVLDAQREGEEQAMQQQLAVAEAGQAIAGAGAAADLAPKLALANQVMPAITGGAQQQPASSPYPVDEMELA